MILTDIVAAITRKLDEEFDSDIPKYVDFIPQDFKRPCFFISMIDMNPSYVLDERYFAEPQFNVQYFEDEGIGSYPQKSLDIQLALRMIELDENKKILARGIRSVLTPDSLHNFFIYPITLATKEEVNAMRSYLLNTRVREVYNGN